MLSLLESERGRLWDNRWVVPAGVQIIDWLLFILMVSDMSN